MSPGQGCEAALKELEGYYGNNDDVTQACIRKALDWPVIRGNVVNALDKISMFLTRCKCTLNMVSVDFRKAR